MQPDTQKCFLSAIWEESVVATGDAGRKVSFVCAPWGGGVGRDGGDRGDETVVITGAASGKESESMTSADAEDDGVPASLCSR